MSDDIILIAATNDDIVVDNRVRSMIERLPKFVTGKIQPLNATEAAHLQRMRLKGKTDGCHVHGDVFDLASIVHVFTAIHPDPRVSPLNKIRLYRGDQVLDSGERLLSCKDVYERAPENEGNFGMAGAEMADLIEQCIADARASGCNCVTARDFRDKLLLYIMENPSLPWQKRLLNFVHGELARYRLDQVYQLVTSSLIDDYQGACTQVFARYMTALHKFHGLHVNNIPRNLFMEEVENHSHTGRHLRSQFRTEIDVSAAHYAMKHGGELPYTFSPLLARCIRRYVNRSLHDALLLSAANGRQDTESKVKERLISKQGHCAFCADMVIWEANQPQPFTSDD